MKYLYLFLVLSVVFFALAAFGASILITRYTRLLSKYYTLVKYLKTLSSAISSARWGNLELRIEEGKTPLTKEISKNLNSLLESSLDRDVMIKEYVQREKENNDIREDFIAMLTHDLKVPIIAQDNTLDLFLDNKFGQLSEVQKDALKNIKISNLDLKHLVESLLDSHKFDKKGFVPDIKKNINLRKFIDDIILQANPVASLHNKIIRLYDRLGPDYTISTDTFLLRRVIQNLILNAISYGINSQYIDITLNDRQEGFEISVKDYGLGISKENIEKIFNKYYSTAQIYSKVSTGLGLYLSNKIIKSLGGKIEAISKENKGSEFKIIMPS